VFGESPREGNLSRQNDPPLIMWWPATGHMTRGEGGGGGEICHFSNSSLTKQYFKILISHNRSVILAPSLLQCQSLPISFLQAVKRENVSYIVTWAYKRPAEAGGFSQSVTLRSTGNISAEGSVKQEQSRPQQHMLFFPLKVLPHTVYIFNIFMWTEVIDSRRL
jgi:hypothetical protein